MHYIYCPECGTKLTDKKAGDDGNVPYCQKCGKMWFDAFSSCVIILPANEYSELAMLRQHYMSDKYWTFVSGFLAFTKKADFTLSGEVDEAEWVPISCAPHRMFPEKEGNALQPLYRKYLQIISSID